MSLSGLFLAGEFVSMPTVKQVLNPYDGSVVKEVCFAGAEHVARAIDAAEQSTRRHTRWPPYKRAELLEKARAGIEARLEEFAEAIISEAGKPRALAVGEVRRCLDTLTDAAFAARSALDTVEPLNALSSGDGRVGIVRRVPVGPVAAISPFNFPLNLVAHKVVVALAAGCPMVLKPASQTPTAALLLAEVLQEAGMPNGMLSVLPMGHGEAAPLTDDKRIKLMSFTGSPEVGWALKARAAHMRVLLELGGNAGNIVCEDADMELACARVAAGGFAYAGQSCISVQRVYAHRSIFSDFVDALAAYTQTEVSAGDPRRPDVIAGPLITPGDADRVQAWTEEAINAGSDLVCGGDRSGSVIQPTVLINTREDLPVMASEVFGPLVNVVPYDNLDDAFARVNASDFGLQAAIFTQDISRVMRAHEELEVGGVVHNDASAFRVDLMPYGGVKNSGLGREGPRHAIYEYTEPRILVIRK